MEKFPRGNPIHVGRASRIGGAPEIEILGSTVSRPWEGAYASIDAKRVVRVSRADVRIGGTAPLGGRFVYFGLRLGGAFGCFELECLDLAWRPLRVLRGREGVRARHTALATLAIARQFRGGSIASESGGTELPAIECRTDRDPQPHFIRLDTLRQHCRA